MEMRPPSQYKSGCSDSCSSDPWNLKRRINNGDHVPMLEKKNSTYCNDTKVLKDNNNTSGTKTIMNDMVLNSNSLLTTKGTKAYRLLGEKYEILHNNETKNSTDLKSNVMHRLLLKNGEINVSRCNIEKQGRKYLADIFTTLIDLKWRWSLGIFTLSFVSSWLTFATIWYAIAFLHGDLKEKNKNNSTFVPCVSGLNNFKSAILISIEIQQTIGFGTRALTDECNASIVIVMIQSSLGLMIQSFMVGIIFTKISRPKKRSETLMWSKNAVVAMRDGNPTLFCRVGDMRKSHIVEGHVRMYMIKKKVSKEGEVLPLTMIDCNVGYDKGYDRVLLIWPLLIEHVIDEASPFYEISPLLLYKERFELVVVLEGIIESTGMTTQARTSYLPSEILWGHRFERLITYQKDDRVYKIDYSSFHKTYEVDTPMISAKELNQIRNVHNENSSCDEIRRLSFRKDIPDNNVDIKENNKIDKEDSDVENSSEEFSRNTHTENKSSTSSELLQTYV